LLGINKVAANENHENSKHPAKKTAGRQNTNFKQISMTEIQNSKQIE